MFTIDIGALGPGLHRLTCHPDVEAVDLDPKKFRAVEVEARLDVSERRILAVLTSRATATLECDRTLRLFDQEIEGSYYLLFAPPEFIDDEEEYDEVRMLEPTDQEIDVTNVVRDTILLAVPTRRIAPGAEEEEIPTTFGAPQGSEANIDPRWEALRTLKTEGDEE